MSGETVTLNRLVHFKVCAQFFELDELDNRIKELIKESYTDDTYHTFCWDDYHKLINPSHGPSGVDQMTTSTSSEWCLSELEFEIPEIKSEDIIQVKRSPTPELPAEIPRGLVNPCQVQEQLTTSSVTAGIAKISLEVEIPSIKTEDIKEVPVQQNSPVKLPAEPVDSTESNTNNDQIEEVDEERSPSPEPLVDLPAPKSPIKSAETINPINALQDYCIRNGLGVGWAADIGHDDVWKVTCRVSTGDEITSSHNNEKMAKVLAAKEMLEMLTNEKIELEEYDDFENYDTLFRESVRYLKQRLKKKGKSGKGNPLPLPETDPKSCFELIKVNYPRLITDFKMPSENVGDSHCRFFEYSGFVEVTIYAGDSKQSFQRSAKAAGRNRVKKTALRAAYAKLLIEVVNEIKIVEESHGNILFEI